MIRRTFSETTFILLLIVMLTLTFGIKPVRAEPKTWIVDDDGPADFHTIHEALDAADSGDTIQVKAGIYYEHLVINKAVSLIGENKETTIIDGNRTGDIVQVQVLEGNVTITGFTVRNSGPYWPDDGIIIHYGNNCNISLNNIVNNTYGIEIWSSGNSIVGNNISANSGDGIRLSNSNNNRIAGNNFEANEWNGIRLESSPNNNILKNNIKGNILNGLYLYFSSNNTVIHNNFVDNVGQQAIAIQSYNSIWDNGYPSGGNYWNDHFLIDSRHGPGQNQTGSDGISDEPYQIDPDNYDHYPFMGPFTAFDAGTWNEVTYYVDVASNSAVSGFLFNPEQTFLSFNVAGLTGAGFSRVAIPKKLLWTEDSWVVQVDLVPVTPTITEDDDYTYLYFTYTHSTKTVKIIGTNAIPEFPSATILSLFMAFAMLPIIFLKRRPSRKPKP